jgi:hypothetical protein
MSYERCTTWQRDGRIWVGQPVPDGASSLQRAFEAHIAHQIAGTVRDRQIGSAVLGITKVEPWADCPVLHPHPEMTWRIIAGLLPDKRDDGTRGVPGLRPLQVGDDLLLRQADTGAQVLLSGCAAELSTSIRSTSAVAQARVFKTSMDESEKADQRDWETTGEGRKGKLFADARDYLLSRVLRRPGIINKTGLIHSQVNTYSHGYDDLAVQWCCGTLVGELAESFLTSGLCSVPAARGFVWRRTTRLDLATDYPDRTIELKLGPARVTLMSAATTGTESCREGPPMPAEWGDSDTRARRWHENKAPAERVEGSRR